MKVNKNNRPAIQDKRALVLWAADCAGRVLRLFQRKHPRDNRPSNAIKAARAWARGKATVSQARAAAVAAHAAARKATDLGAIAAARAAGHAAGTAHAAGHARAALAYALKAVSAAAANAEQDRQYKRLPKHLRVFSAPPRQ